MDTTIKEDPENPRFPQIIPLKWEVGCSNTKNEQPEAYYPANIPGAVQLDFMQAEGHPDWQFSDRFKQYLPFEDKYWHYQAKFGRPNIPDDYELIFRSEGIDYAFEVCLNGELLHDQTGMFSPVDLTLSSHLKDENQLEVTIFPVPKTPGAEVGRREADTAVKPAVSYGWDFHPRLVPLGIWDETELVIMPKTKIKDTELRYVLNSDDTAQLEYRFETTRNQSLNYKWKLLDREGLATAQRTGKINGPTHSFKVELDHVNRWWSHDLGEPYLYRLELQLIDDSGKVIDSIVEQVGFRTVKLVMNEGTWDEVRAFPKSRSSAPFQLELNGKRIFTKGSNWVPPEVFYGKIDEARYRELLELFKSAHFNLLRVWGGGIINKKSFYEICDELGILLWQEFPLACNAYPDDPEYLKVLEQEARSIIPRMRRHACMSTLCGGNELFNNWSGMDDQSHVLRLLNSLCYQLAPEIPYINTSPLMGVGHGHYLFYDEESGEDVFQLCRRAHNTAYPEFGVPGIADRETLESIIPEDELYPPRASDAWIAHHAYEAWQSDSWLELKTVEKYFGKAHDLETVIKHSQLLQAVGYQCWYESSRIKQPYCSMVLNWCFNEPWPTAANNSLISYPAKPKPAYYQVVESCRPVLACASFAKFSWTTEELLEISCYLLNDSQTVVDSGEVEVFIQINGNQQKIGNWAYPKLSTDTNFTGPILRYPIPEMRDKTLFQIQLKVANRPEYDSEYHLHYHAPLRERETSDTTNL